MLSLNLIVTPTESVTSNIPHGPIYKIKFLTLCLLMQKLGDNKYVMSFIFPQKMGLDMKVHVNGLCKESSDELRSQSPADKSH